MTTNFMLLNYIIRFTKQKTLNAIIRGFHGMKTSIYYKKSFRW